MTAQKKLQKTKRLLKKLKANLDRDDPTPNEGATAKSLFAAKTIKAKGWILYDDTNPSDYDIMQCE